MTVNQILERTELLFIGGGPVGLWTAVQTKLRDPELNITILEKHSEYKRSHVLQLNPRSFNGAFVDDRLQAVIKGFKEARHIRTTQIEKNLAELAHQIGVRILKEQNVTEPSSLVENYPAIKVVVGSDGSHSNVRRQVFGNKMRFNQTLSMVCEVKYEVEGKASKLNWIRTTYPTLKVIQGVASEHIGSEKEGRTPVTLRFSINKKVYENMQGASFASPYSLDEEMLHQTVREKVVTWLNVRREVLKENRINGSEKITVTRLDSYASEHFATFNEKEERVWALVGDAAFGVPFFRSLNNGFLTGTRLAGTLALYFRNRNIEVFTDYNHYVKRLAGWEIFVSKVKSFFIQMFEVFVKLSGVVPWQINRWTDTDIIELSNGMISPNPQLKRS